MALIEIYGDKWSLAFELTTPNKLWIEYLMCVRGVMATIDNNVK